jgi:molybdopterin-dependent oxidoreductase alpha subunit
MLLGFLSRLNPFRGWRPARWAGWVPNGLGQVKPNHYGEMLSVAWRNRDRLPYAWRILTRGVCDGCALGTSGLSDWTMDGVHLCMVRLELLRLNTMPALDPARLARVADLAAHSSRALRGLGRLPYPMLRRAGEPGFRRLSWDEAYDLVAARWRRTDPSRIAFYLTSRGLTNEVYYVAQKVARFLGTNHIDNSARLCHAASTVALTESLGVGAASCSYSDWIGTDLLVFFGSHVPNNQPVTTKYIYYAKQQGTRVLVVNPYREPGLERYWVPSVLESALFGTRLADRFFGVDTGGDAAFLSGVLKDLVERGGLKRDFVAAHTTGFEAVEQALRAAAWPELEAASGAARQDMEAFAEELRRAENAVFVWSMGLTQHAHGVENVQALVNLALARGYLGRPKNGVVPIRGHSGVQGGAEVGAVPGHLPGGVRVGSPEAARLASLWGFVPPEARGLSAAEMVEAAGRGEIDALYAAGGNFLETLPDAAAVRAALARTPLRVHQDIVVTTQMLVEPGEAVLLLPARTRYEQEGGGTETTTERRIVFSPEIPGPRPGEARSEWRILMEIAERAYPERRCRIHFEDAAAIRREMAQAVPFYAGIERLERAGDHIQYGGPRLHEGGIFPLPGGRARLRPARYPAPAARDGALRLSTRRGKQFNSMVQAERDPLTGAWRDAVLIAPSDAGRLGLRHGDGVRLIGEGGEFVGRAFLAPLHPGNVQVHWPEGNALLPPHRRAPVAGVPDYNARVVLEPLAAGRA